MTQLRLTNTTATILSRHVTIIPRIAVLVALLYSRDVSPRGQSGLEAKILVPSAVSASNIWPRPGLGRQQKNQQSRSQEETDQSVC